MGRQNQYLYEGYSTKMDFPLMNHASEQMLPCIEERVKIGEEVYT